ncbi:carboxylesterase/lipase family protein [Tsukamurella tyrosinosolvens]|uniref:carboxylesterase/lipase family protein n=1 Tax=Tsukamurella tyrosinosolvens TaxID=57704 RepID=UPI000C7F30E3|nr:carboxylesterase family protein [Tsukamurella tyrosinosolvens]AUN41599.1 carboxylesterase [Tsukamurella tyrosinosolvens]
MSVAEERPEVKIDTGVVRGRWRPTVGGPAGVGATRSAEFLGIPFAEAPVGGLRFGAPVPRSPWDGVLDAGAYGATAQRGDPGVVLIPEPSIPGDGTLNVNVFTPSPEHSDGAGLPVLVWIHGGGYFAGSPASPWYDGRNFNRDGVVTVTVSYRLGFDGFGWIEDAPSNRGVRDWLLALDWVQRNIAAFGGDPARVTLAGQSAGGGAVLTLLGMEAAQHLFSRAIVMSGVLAAASSDRAEAFGRDVARRAGVAPTLAGMATVPEERLLRLQRKATSIDLPGLRAAFTHGLPLGPTVDGDLLPQGTIAALRSGVGADKPVLIGATDDEFTRLFVDAPLKYLMPLLPTAAILALLAVPRALRADYLTANPDVLARGSGALAGRLLSDAMFRVTVPRIADFRASTPGAAPIWTYRFSWTSGPSGIAGHCLDVPFFFDCLDGPAIEPLAGPRPPQALADQVHGAAVTFVTDGAPGWPASTATAPISRVFDVPVRDVPDAYASARPLLTHSRHAVPRTSAGEAR